MSQHPRLIACVLGGIAPGAKTELHDVAYAVGDSLEAVHEQLLDGWFGEPRGLHVDAWCFLDSVSGYRVQLTREPADDGPRLYFVNIGGYRPGVFAEHHAWGFFGAPDQTAARDQAQRTLLRKHEETHKDELYDVDDCLQVADIAGWHVRLTPDPNAKDPIVCNGYFPLPQATIDRWLARRNRPVELPPFHLAFPVHSLAEARAFYGELLGCLEGRSSDTWVDFDFHGHQIVAHLAPEELRAAVAHDVDGDAVPVRHFGAVLDMPAWHALADKLRTAGTHFVIEPHVRFKGQPGEQATMFLLDPSGNALEFKAFADRSRLFAK
ncbi:MAG: DUF1543 domain-containing protein [Xanthomonadaceae bacterium]|nr:DUF1543 domain-containing protein [Xanthomonadaceae bacterium]